VKLLNYKVVIPAALLLLLLLKIAFLSTRTGLVLAAVIPLVLLLVFLLRMALRSHQVKVITGDVGMIGLTGRAETELSPEGTVFVRGELWRARAGIRIAAGERVRVVKVDGLTLEVELADKDRAMMTRRVSILDQQ
jgi:membrane-bound serine protease (ClpP class)